MCDVRRMCVAVPCGLPRASCTLSTCCQLTRRAKSPHMQHRSNSPILRLCASGAVSVPTRLSRLPASLSLARAYSDRPRPSRRLSTGYRRSRHSSTACATGTHTHTQTHTHAGTHPSRRAHVAAQAERSATARGTAHGALQWRWGEGRPRGANGVAQGVPHGRTIGEREWRSATAGRGV